MARSREQFEVGGISVVCAIVVLCAAVVAVASNEVADSISGPHVTLSCVLSCTESIHHETTAA